MPDEAPDSPEVGSTSPTSGGRRSGLDRLRTARGAKTETASSTEAGHSSADRAVSAATSPAATSPIVTDKPGATALLDTATEAPDRPGVAPEDAGSSAGGGTVEEPPAKESGGTSRSRRGWWARREPGSPASRGQLIAALVLGLLVIGLLVPVVAMRHRIVGQSKEQKSIGQLVDKKTEALGFARRFAITFFSPNYKTIDDYSNQIAAQSTGQFQQDFNGKRGQLKSLLTQVQSQATGKVLAAGVSKVSGNDVEVLVVADQDVTNSTTKGKTVTNRYRVRVSLQKTNKGWLVTDLEPVV